MKFRSGLTLPLLIIGALSACAPESTLASAGENGTSSASAVAEASAPETAADIEKRERFKASKEAGFDHPGEQLYKENCAICHDQAESMRAPTLSDIKNMSAPSLRYALTDGKMKQQAAALESIDLDLLIDYLIPGGAEGYLVPEEAMCKSDSISFDKVIVETWGVDPQNTRYYGPDKSQLSAADAGNLELAWSFGLPGVSSVRSQPVVTSDTMFVPSTNGDVFALDRASGCVKWHRDIQKPVRTSVSLGAIKGKPTLFMMDVATGVHAVDAATGDLIWSVKTGIDENSMGTGTPVVAGNKLIVPLSASDVVSAMNPEYECCKGHGAVKALDMATGKELWTVHMTEPAKMTTLSSVGTQLWGPSGAPVWTTPAVDLKNNRVYIGTGENTSAPATDTSDSIIALDLDTGEMLWVHQGTKEDMFNMACSGMRGNGPNCPTPAGPDHDFGGGVSMATLADGREVIVGGQKSGDVHVADAGTGELIWTRKVSSGSALGGIHWGVSVSNGRVYAPSADPAYPIPGYVAKPGLYVLDLESGDMIWEHKAERGCEFDFASRGKSDTPWPECSFAYGYSATPATNDELAVIGALDGKLIVFDAKSGETLWTYNTVQEYATLNGITAHGGAIDSVGPFLAEDMLYVQSGYATFGQMPGNVLLAFKVKEGN